MVYDDLAFCSCFVVTWASVCRRGLSSLPGGLLAGVGAGGELVDLGAGQDDAAAGAGDRADGELPAGNEVPQPRFAQAEQAGDLTDAVRQPLGGGVGADELVDAGLVAADGDRVHSGEGGEVLLGDAGLEQQPLERLAVDLHGHATSFVSVILAPSTAKSQCIVIDGGEAR